MLYFLVWSFFKQKDLYLFLYEKLKEAVTSLLQSVAQSLVVESSIRKPVKQDFSLDTNLLPAQLLVWVFWCCQCFWKQLRFGWSALDATEINNFRKNTKAMTKKIVHKLVEYSPLRLANCVKVVQVMVFCNTNLEDQYSWYRESPNHILSCFLTSPYSAPP